MKKIISLIKASMTEDMNIFRINSKKNNKFTKIFLPVFLALYIMGVLYWYSKAIIVELEKAQIEYALLTIFILLTSIMTLIEGIYKSGNLLFNCTDDNLLLSLPIKKSTVLFIRIFKFYIFELLYNSLFLLPAVIVYAVHVHPNTIYYLISFIGLIVFPIIPILLSSLIGSITTFISSKFKGKNIIQTLLTFILLLGIIYFSYNFEGIISNIAEKAYNLSDLITKIYYPAGAYIELITKFSLLKLLEFIVINLGLFIISIILMGKIYFKLNSNVKSIKTNNKNKKYVIKSSRPIVSLIKKEFNRFINSPVFITNAGLGLVLFILGCILITVKLNSINDSIISSIPELTINIVSYIPIGLFAFIFLTSFMTSITSSMISLEGKSINILKSLPLKPNTIIKSKVLTAILIMLPCIVIGDVIVFIRFSFDFLSIILVLIASVLFPLVSETIGIIINLKYPKVDAKNDTEVVKQSMSSFISVFIGMFLIGITLPLIVTAVIANISTYIVMLGCICIYLIIYIGLVILLNKKSKILFEAIT